MTKFAELNQFEFIEDAERRQITLITHNERTVLQFPTNYSEKKFAQTYDFFLDFSPRELHKVMGEIANQIPGALLIGEIKPGEIHDARHKPEFFINRKGDTVNRDRWHDGLTYEEWCSDEQVAKEYYGRRKQDNTGVSLSEGDGSEYVPFKPKNYDPKIVSSKPIPSPQKKEDDKSVGDILDDLFG